jgi:hypothetical protein
MAHYILIMLSSIPQMTVAVEHNFVKVNMTKCLYHSQFISLECVEYFEGVSVIEV